MSDSTTVVFTVCIASLAAQAPAHPPVVGRWDLTVSGGEGRHLPSWLEVHWSGGSAIHRNARPHRRRPGSVSPLLPQPLRHAAMM
jgi:hypothetical protein